MKTDIARPQETSQPRRRKAGRWALVAVGALALACSGAQAQGRGGWHGGGWHGGGWGWGPAWGGLGLAVGLDLAASSYYYNNPNYVVVSPPVYYAPPPPPAVVYSSAQPAAAVAPDPIFYPRNGQTAAQTEADRQACNSWATTQPRAMADASVFQRATLACMDGRGYTAR